MHSYNLRLLGRLVALAIGLGYPAWAQADNSSFGKSHLGESQTQVCSSRLSAGAVAATAKTAKPSKMPVTPLSEEQQEVSEWQKTGLTIKSLVKMGIINEKCQDNESVFLRCIVALNGLLNAGGEKYELMPTNLIDDEYKKVIEKIEGPLGQFTLVKLKSESLSGGGQSVKAFLQREKERTLKLHAEIRSLWQRQALSPADMLKLFEQMFAGTNEEALKAAGAINAAFELYDPHARITPDSSIEKAEATAGDRNFIGIGVQMMKAGGKYLVEKLAPGGPAEKAGLLVGDILELIGSERVHGIAGLKTIEKVRGPEGTSVNITVNRDGERKRITIVRKPIITKNVEFQLVDDVNGKVGVIKLSSFSNESACLEVAKAIAVSTFNGASRLVLDLRGNSGGLLHQAVCIAGLFIGKEVVAAAQPLTGGPFQVYGSGQKRMTELPLAVLVNHASASGSEMLAGALRDHHRAWIIGTRTFGKGSVQEAKKFAQISDSTDPIMAYITTHRFYQPSGSSNQLVGITPNFEVPAKPGQRKDITEFREEDMYVNAIPADGPDWEEDRTEEVKLINECRKQSGQARLNWQRARENKQFADFQLLSAIDVLNCYQGY